jgi:tetratricopeptide (TPR) repeat protein
MADLEYDSGYHEICGHLAARRLKPAFDKMGSLIAGYGMGLLYDEYHNLEETYRFMLKYTVEGIRDPERQKIYRKLIVSAYDLADKLNAAISLRVSPSVEYEKKRMFSDEVITDPAAFITGLGDFYRPDNTTDREPTLEDTAIQHRRMRRLFCHIWFRDKLSSVETESMRSFFQNSMVPVHYRSFLVTAVTLSLLRCFDEAKFSLLFDAFSSGEEEIRQLALVGLLIGHFRYDDRLSFYPEITGRLKLLAEEHGFLQNIERIIIQLIRSKETEKLIQRIRDEILPEMIRISPNLRNKINLDSLMEEGLPEDKNPDWEELFSDSPGLLSKMEEFSELQMEGADVFMGSFAMLKSFPFYQEVTNWFLPFFPWNPEIDRGRDDLEVRLLEALSHTPVLCNSDKYSFCFSLRMLPQDNREFMASAIDAEEAQWKELEQDEGITDPGRRAGFISNQYIQDLYRFYKLYPRKNGLEDIFGWRFDFHNLGALGALLGEDPGVLRNIGEFYFLKNQYTEATDIFSRLLNPENSGELYQKIAYGYQKSGDYEKALDGYLKAGLYDINRVWNLKKTALCYRNLKQPAKALEYYREAESLDPDDLNTHLNIGHCLLELNEFDEALKSYFRVEYLAPGNPKVWRPVAWCCFLTGRNEQAGNYYRKLLEVGPTHHDLMNMGHVEWSLGNRQAALDFYRQSVSAEGFTLLKFMEVFAEDLPNLTGQGIDPDDVPIMLDQLRYLLES